MEKASFYSNPEEGQYQRIFRLTHNCLHNWSEGFASHASKVMPQILHARLQVPDLQAELEKAEEPDIKLPTSIGS